MLYKIARDFVCIFGNQKLSIKALTNNDILNLINFIIRKENKGNTLTRSRFSDLLQIQGLEYFEILYDRYEQTKEMSDSLRRFKSQGSTGLTVANNKITLPADYAHEASLYYNKGGTSVKPVYLATDDQFMMMQNSVLDEPTDDYPIGRLTTDYLEYRPTTLTTTLFVLDYLRYPTDAVYDYYIDANGYAHYLASGATHTWATGEIDSTGTTHTVGDPDWSSLTSELDFEEEDKIKIAYKILQTLGVTMSEAGVFQYAEQVKNES